MPAACASRTKRCWNSLVSSSSACADGTDGLQRDEAADERIFGEVDDTHRSLAELANDLVAAELHLVPLSPRQLPIRWEMREPPIITPTSAR